MLIALFLFLLTTPFLSCPIDDAAPIIIQGLDHPARSLQTSVTLQPIRILFDYSNYPTDNVVLPVLQSTLSDVQNTLQAILKVPQIWANMTLNSGTCNTASVPLIYQTTGVPADLVVFLTSQSVSGKENLEAWSTPCSVNSQAYNRTVFSQLNILPTKIGVNSYDWRHLYETLLHEMTHILGFNPILFQFFVDPYGNSLGTNNVVQNFTIRGVTKNMIITPNVVQNVRNHFACQNVSGGELEDQGSNASIGSHWERRLFGDEMMSATSIKDSVMSNITLALLGDTGWYQVDYSKAEEFKYGRNLGCSFLYQKCIANSVSLFPNYFTTNLNNDGCWYDFTKRGKSIVTSGSSSAAYSYFPTGWLSYDPYADNCPSYLYYDDGDCRIETDYKIFRLTDNEYGTNSRCFMGTFFKSGNASFYDTHFTNAACFRSKCTTVFNGSVIQVYVGNNTLICPMEGGNITIPGYVGELFCPPSNVFCPLAFSSICPNGCSKQGICLANGTCICKTGYYGGDCAQKYCSSNSDCGSNGICDTSSKKCSCFYGWGGRNCGEFTYEYFSPNYQYTGDSYLNKCIAYALPNRASGCTSTSEGIYLKFTFVLIILIICIIL